MNIDMDKIWTAIATAIVGGAVWLIRQVFTNQKQIALQQAQLDRAGKDFDEVKSDIKDVKADIKRLIERK